MNPRPTFILLSLVPLVLILLLVWPPTVLMQEKVSPSAAQPRSEGELANDAPEFLGEERDAACSRLRRYLQQVSGRSEQHQLTEQDRQLIRDGKRFNEAMNSLPGCISNLPIEGQVLGLKIDHNLHVERIEHLEARERGLVAKYNELVFQHNEFVDLVAAAISHPTYDKPLTLPLVKPVVPIRGPVVCTGDTTALGQGITSVYINCSQ